MASFPENRHNVDDPNDSFDRGWRDDGSFGENTPSKGRTMAVPFVLLGGFCTTVFALAVNFLINVFADFDPFVFLLIFGIIPVGAFLFGLVAGSGYGITARLLQFFPAKRFMMTIFVLQLILFFAGRYAEFKIAAIFVPNPPGFIEVYREYVEGFAWQGKNGNPPIPLGKLGYLLELATAVLFSLGALVGLGILFGIPYCSQCKVFMRKQMQFAIPASAKRTKVKKKDVAGQEQLDQENTVVFKRATDYVSKLMERLNSGEQNDEQNDVENVVAILAEIQKEAVVSKKELRQYWHQLSFDLSRCPNCPNFSLNIRVVPTNAQDKSTPPLPGLWSALYADGQFKLLEGFGKIDETDASQEDLSPQ